MATNYLFGREQQDLIGNQSKYFYGLKRNDNGELTFTRVNQLSRTDAININDVGDINNNYDQFEIDVDFFEGRDVYHNIVYANLLYEQYHWDDRSIYYYVDTDGQLVARINTKYTYPTGISS
jgi:hypothetical protein